MQENPNPYIRPMGCVSDHIWKRCTFFNMAAYDIIIQEKTLKGDPERFKGAADDNALGLKGNSQGQFPINRVLLH